RLFAAAAFAKLQIGPEAPRAHGDVEPGRRIFAEFLVADFAVAVRSQRTRIAAFGIIRAADEGAEFGEFQPQPAVAAGRAYARIGAVLARREQMRRQHLIERVDHAGNLQILGAADGADEVAPEIAQHFAPRHFAVGDEIELFFEARGEIVFDVLG